MTSHKKVIVRRAPLCPDDMCTGFNLIDPDNMREVLFACPPNGRVYRTKWIKQTPRFDAPNLIWMDCGLGTFYAVPIGNYPIPTPLRRLL